MLGLVAKYACIGNLASWFPCHYFLRQIMRKIVKVLSNEKERTSLHSSLFSIFSPINSSFTLYLLTRLCCD